MGILKKILVFSSAISLVLSQEAIASKRLSGAGATFPSKIYTRWFFDLAKSGGPRVNYQAVGSGSGRKAFIDETVNFGASDDPMKAKDIEKVSRGLVQIPMVGGTIAFGYNYDCDLKLTQEQAVRVAMGMVKNWKELGCKSGKLTWTHRSDGSGTTKAFTNSMEAFSPTWTLGTGKSVKWPAGDGAKGNSGVAGVIQNTPGAIGYVNQSYIKGNVKAAALQNLSGEFLKPSAEAGAKALKKGSITNIAQSPNTTDGIAANNSTKEPIISLTTFGTKSSVINIAVPTPRGIVINSERNEVTNVPYIAAKAPYSSFSGFHSEVTRNFKPYLEKDSND